MYNDGINQIGKYVGKTGKNANRALKKSEPDYAADEIARDIFDPVVSYVMYFTTSRPNQSIKADLKFELPPPNIGLGKCCGDCYCSKCEIFFFDDFDSQIILTEYPYVAGTVRVFDAYGNTSLVTETDPDAGIVDLGYDPDPSPTNKIYVCYVYRYDGNCTTNEPIPEEPWEPGYDPTDGQGYAQSAALIYSTIKQSLGQARAVILSDHTEVYVFAQSRVVITGGDRPFAAPHTTATYTVPDAIDRTGATNAADDLQSWINSTVPDGSIIDFVHAGGIYRLDDGLLFEGRNNLIIRGNSDTTLIMNGSDAETFSTFLMRNSHHIAIEGFTVNGAYSTFPNQDGELSHCLGISGFFNGGASTYIEMKEVIGDHFYGDFVYVEGSNGGAFPPAQYIWVHHNDFDYCGRNGFSFINVQDAWFQYNTVDHVAYHAIDFEANFDAEETTRIIIELNDFGSYGHRGGLIGYFAAAFSPNNPSVSELTIRNNTVAGIAANGYNGAPLGLHSKFLGTSGNHYTYIIFTGNTCTQTVSGSSIIYFDYVDHATVTGNTQPGAGTLVGAANSTDITSNPNP